MKNLQQKAFLATAVLPALLLPLEAFAQTKSKYCGNTFQGSFNLGGTSTFGDVIKFITCFITQLIIPLIFALAVLVFVWGGVKFIQSTSTEDREKGQQFMLWGVIALAVMVGVWGLVAILGNTFGVNNVIPQLRIQK